MQQTEQHQQIFLQYPSNYYKEKSIVSDSTYVDYLHDSLNPKLPDTAFVLPLKEIILPVDTVDNSQKIVEYKPSIFYPDKSGKVNINPQFRKIDNYDWLTGIFITCLLILTWIRFEGEKRIGQIFKAVVARHNMNQMLRDGDIIHERITPALAFMYIISLSTFIFSLLRRYDIEIHGIETPYIEYLVICSAIMFLWFLKIASIRVSGKIFRTKHETEEYLVTNIIFNTSAGLLTFPFVFAHHFTNNTFSLAIVLFFFSIFLIMKFLRSIFVGLSAQTFPVIYLFLYLCTLEILPLLIFYKLLF